MGNTAVRTDFQVNLTLYVAGPVRPGKERQRHQLLRCEKTISLPFVPYPGLHLTISKPARRDWPLSAYLRVRTVEWLLNEEHFRCVVDEVSLSYHVTETSEVRGRPLDQVLFDAV